MTEYPILKPLLALLKSRKFLVAVLTLLVDTVGSQYPEFAPFREPVYALGLAIIATIAVEDFAAKRGNGGQG